MRVCSSVRDDPFFLSFIGSCPRGTDSEQLPEGRRLLAGRNVLTDIER